MLGAVLDHPGAQRRELFDLMARGQAARTSLVFAEDVAASAARGPVLDHLIHGASREQIAPAALVPGLTAGLTPAAVLASAWACSVGPSLGEPRSCASCG